ncbi:MAG: hypothetical protein AAGJ46_01535 [Planctomycetota bacterium]
MNLARRTSAALLAAVAVCQSTVGAEPIPPELADLFNQLGIVVGDGGQIVPPEPPVTPAPPVDPIDPIQHLIDLGILPTDFDPNTPPSSPDPTPLPPAPTEPPTNPLPPVDPIQELVDLGILPPGFELTAQADPPLVDPAPRPVEPPLFDAPIEQLIAIGVLPPDFVVTEPVDVAPPPVDLARPSDPLDFLRELGLIPLDTTPVSQTLAASPEPGTALLLASLVAGLGFRRGRAAPQVVDSCGR